MVEKSFSGIVIVILFALAVASVSLYYSSQAIDPEILGTMTTEEIQLYVSGKGQLPLYIIPLLSFIGLLAGAFSYSVMNSHSPAAPAEKADTKPLLSFLDPLQRAAVEKLIESGGKCRQMELTHLPGLNKVKTHRVLNDLERKGVIKREKYGKTNIIALDKRIQDLLG